MAVEIALHMLIIHLTAIMTTLCFGRLYFDSLLSEWS